MIHPTHEYHHEAQAFHGFVPLLMGTRLELLICEAEKNLCEGLWKRMCDRGEEMEKMMNRFDPESEVSRLNASGYGPLSPGMAEAIALCEHYRKTTGGLFDIGRGTVDWSKALFTEGNFSKISLGGGNIDFGGFGKGFLLKIYKEMMLDAGITTAYVDFGGSSIMVLGHHPYGDCWKVGVTDPFSGKQVMVLELTDMSMSTSGNQPGYEGHIIDPRNGSAICGGKLVTILSPDPLTAEIASTAVMIAGGDEIVYIKENNDIASIFCTPSTRYGK